MKKFNVFLFVLTGCLSLSLMAQQPPEPIKPPVPPGVPLAPEMVEPSAPEMLEPSTPEMEELRKQLKEARRRLEQAAREVAEKSAQMYQGRMPLMRAPSIAAFGAGKGAMLGVHIEEAKDDKGNPLDGVDVVGVTPNGAAGKAGLQNGDRIIAINAESLQWRESRSPTAQLMALMAEVEPGQLVTVDYVRDGEAKSVVVETEQLNNFQTFGAAGGGNFNLDFHVGPSDDDLRKLKENIMVFRNGIQNLYDPHQRPWHELELLALTPKLGGYFDTDKGILVVSNNNNDELKLEEGDVILNIDGREPANPAHTIRILNSYSPGETVTFGILRQRRKKSIEYKIKEMNEDVMYRWHDNGIGDKFFEPWESGNRPEPVVLKKENSI